VYLDGAPAGVLARDSHERALRLPAAAGELTLVVEDQGRVDYGPRIGEHKGLVGGVRLDGEVVTGWAVTALDIDRVPSLPAVPAASGARGPLVLRGTFDLSAPSDLFLDTSDWGKGLAWLNGFALGRYWRRGPQATLYVPGPVTRAGRNELVVLEFEAMADPTARFVDRLRLGPTEY
jgi:beta-galactosidase